MNKKRFELRYDLIQEINAKGELIDVLTDDEVVDLLNSLYKENEQLKRRLEKINRGYGHLTHRKGLTANEWVINFQEKEIDSLKALLKEKETITEENEQLKSTITHLQEECGARENDYANLKKQLDKIPPRIKEIWIK